MTRIAPLLDARTGYTGPEGSRAPELPKSLEAMLRACWEAAQARQQTYEQWRQAWADAKPE